MSDHADKCCRLHGCLLDGNCPVEVGGVIQNGPCVLCPPVGQTGWDNGLPLVLRTIAELIDENTAATESPWVKLPHIGDVMRRTRGRANPKLVVQLLHVLGGTEHQQTSGSLRPIGVDSSLEMELEMQIECGDAIHKGSMHVSRDMWEEMTKMFDKQLGDLRQPASFTDPVCASCDSHGCGMDPCNCSCHGPTSLS